MLDNSSKPNVTIGQHDHSTGADEIRQAQQFLAEFRKHFAEYSNGLRGGLNLSDAQMETIHLIMEQSHVLEGANGSAKAVKSLIERFEEAARRIKQPVPDALKPAIYHELARELAVNAETFRISAVDAVKSTLPLGIISRQKLLEGMGGYYDDKENLVKYVVQKNADPRAKLQSILEVVTNAPHEEEFREYFESRPSLAQKIASQHTDARKKMRDVITKVKEIESQDETGLFEGNRSLLMEICTDHKDVPKEIERMLLSVHNIAQDKELSALGEASGRNLLRMAAKSSNLAATLSAKTKLLAAIESEAEFKPLMETNRWVVAAAVFDHKNAREHLRETMRKAEEIKADPELATFAASAPAFVYDIAYGHEGSCDKLKEALHVAADIEADPSFNDIPLRGTALIRYIVRHEKPLHDLALAGERHAELALARKSDIEAGRLDNDDLWNAAIRWPNKSNQRLDEIIIEKTTGRAPQANGRSPSH